MKATSSYWVRCPVCRGGRSKEVAVESLMTRVLLWMNRLDQHIRTDEMDNLPCPQSRPPAPPLSLFPMLSCANGECPIALASGAMNNKKNWKLDQKESEQASRDLPCSPIHPHAALPPPVFASAARSSAV